MKNGLFMEAGKLVYYVNDVPRHAGVVRINGDIYYIGSHGIAVKGRHVVRTAMSNDILKHGTYTFGDDYKLVKGSYIPPEKIRSSKKGKKKVKKLIKNKKLRMALPIALIAIVLLLVLVFDENSLGGPVSRKDETAVERGSAQIDEYLPPVSLPEFEEEVLLCTEAAQQVYNGEMTMEEVYKTGNPYRSLAFQYNLYGRDGLLLLSENPKLTGADEYVLDGKETVLLIDNLKTGTTYYYKVKVDGEEHVGSFRTAKSTRYLNIPGAQNVRDIGGYQTLDGKMVKQGLLIRGTEIDGLEQPYLMLASKDVEDVQNTFGFVHDMDLRYNTIFSDEYQTPLGKDVTHTVYHSPQYGQIFNVSWQYSLHRIISDLADPAKYPMYVHCSAGKDRTGTVIFLLQGILNMSEEEMLQEFHRSGFSFPEMATTDYMDAVVAGLQPYEGETLQEKIVTFLTTAVGVTNEEIESIRRIFLED